MSSRTVPAILVAGSMFFAAQPALAGPTLDAVRQAGVLGCGVIGEPGDFTKDDTHGDTTAFGSDICRALGAAVLGDASDARVDGFPDAASGYKALQAGKIDVLVGVTPVPGVAKHYGAAYAQPVFFEGQGFLVNKRSGIASLADLRGRSICYIADSDAERSAHAVLDPKGLAFKPFPFEEMGEMEAALVSGHCEAETHDVTTLANGRSHFHGRIADYAILADTITLDPLAPAVRAGDSEWVQIVDWLGYALVQAEISGVTRANAAAMSKSADLTLATLLGGRRGMGYSLGLANDWGLKAIEAVGNYGELYERDLGLGSSYRLPRGLNRPWTQGGLMWAPPFR